MSFRSITDASVTLLFNLYWRIRDRQTLNGRCSFYLTLQRFFENLYSCTWFLSVFCPIDFQPGYSVSDAHCVKKERVYSEWGLENMQNSIPIKFRLTGTLTKRSYLKIVKSSNLLMFYCEIIPQQAQYIYPMLAWCWASVGYDGPALGQNLANVSYLLGGD